MQSQHGSLSLRLPDVPDEPPERSSPQALDYIHKLEACLGEWIREITMFLQTEAAKVATMPVSGAKRRSMGCQRAGVLAIPTL